MVPHLTVNRQMKVSLLLTFMVILALSCSTKGQKAATTQKDSTLRILVYGLPDFERQNAEGLIARKYGFIFYGVAGCDVSSELEDSVERENKPVYALLEKKYGKDFWKRFWAEVEAECQIEKEVEKLLWQQPYLKQKEAVLAGEGNGLHFDMDWTPKKGVYSVIANGWGTWQGEDRMMVYYRLKVDLNQRKVQLLSDKTELYY